MKTIQPLYTALVLFLLSFITFQAVLLQNNPKVLGVVSQTGYTIPSNPINNSGVPCKLIDNWQKQYCSVVPTPASLSCDYLLQNQKDKFLMCGQNGYSNICFNKYTGVYQGCDHDTPNTCTENNSNAANNIRCTLPVGTFPTNTPTPKPTTYITPTPGPQTNFLNVVNQTCLADGNVSVLIKGNASLSTSSPSGYWMRIEDDQTGVTITRGWQSGSGYNNPVSDDPNDLVWDTKNSTIFPLVGDGRMFTYSIYEGPYADTPQLNRFLASTVFGMICPKMISSTPTPRTPICTPVMCQPGQGLYCPTGSCPGGCGYICGNPSPTPAPSYLNYIKK